MITQKTSISHLVQVNGWAAVVGDVGMHVEVPHAHLSEVPGVVLVEINPVKSGDFETFEITKIQCATPPPLGEKC
jgi:hypothetical protein